MDILIKIFLILLKIFIPLHLCKYGISYIIDYYTSDIGIVFILFRKLEFYTIKYENIESCQAHYLYDST